MIFCLILVDLSLTLFVHRQETGNAKDLLLSTMAFDVLRDTTRFPRKISTGSVISLV